MPFWGRGVWLKGTERDMGEGGQKCPFLGDVLNGCSPMSKFVSILPLSVCVPLSFTLSLSLSLSAHEPYSCSTYPEIRER